MMKGRELKVAAKHWFGCRGDCLSCNFALDWNLWRQFCDCGAKATGYRAMGADVDVEFFCDEHFQDAPPAPDKLVALSWSCTKCGQGGAVNVWQHEHEREENTARRYERELRQRCVTGCVYQAALHGGTPPAEK